MRSLTLNLTDDDVEMLAAILEGFIDEMKRQGDVEKTLYVVDLLTRIEVQSNVHRAKRLHESQKTVTCPFCNYAVEIQFAVERDGKYFHSTCAKGKKS